MYSFEAPTTSTEEAKALFIFAAGQSLVTSATLGGTLTELYIVI